MVSKKARPSPNASLPFKTDNKERRHVMHVRQKKARDVGKREERFRRKREEDQDPSLREERLRHNVPATLDNKRVWDTYDDEIHGDGLGLSFDVGRREKKQRTDDGQEIVADDTSVNAEENDDDDDGIDSMLGSGSETDADGGDEDTMHPGRKSHPKGTTRKRAASPAQSTTSTNLDLTPEALAARFPTLFQTENPPVPKVLVTTSLNSTLYHEAQLLTTLLPYSVFIPRSAHRYGYKFSVREIASFATNRNYTTLVILKEDQKKPTGLSMVHLPHGPTFHFSISNWVDGKRLPGHGNPTGHDPELILNNFRTPLGLLTAHLFRSLFPSQPQLEGRQVVTLHNQRDYIFVRRHRYVFRDKRASEKSVVGADGKVVVGAEGIRAGLQELGPRFTMKLRRIDKGIGRAGSNGVTEWQWKGGMEKERTKFQL